MNLRELGLDLQDLRNVEFPTGSLVDGYVLMYDIASGNFQPTAIASHTHVEADITDLDHNAVKFQGYDIEAPGTGHDRGIYFYDETSGTFELVVIPGIEEANPTNPIVTLKDIYVEYLEDNTVSSTTDQVNWTPKATLYFTPIEEGEYFISWQASLANSGQNKGCVAQIILENHNITGFAPVTVGEAINAPIVAGAYNTSSGFIRVTLGTTEHHLHVEFMAEAGTALLKDVRILVQRTLTIV